jgi:outer membrane protein
MKKLLMALLLLGAIGAKAQNSKHLTLQEAFSLAVSNSKQLALSTATLKEAQARLEHAKDQAWPEVKASATYLHINSPSISMKGSDNSGGSSSGSNSMTSLFSNLHDIGLTQLSVSQPVFAGFKIRYTKVMERYLTEAAKYDTTTAKNKVLLNAASALYQYYEILQTKALVEKNLKQAQQRVAEFKNLEAQSLLPRNDRLKAELQVNNIELTRTDISNNLALAEYTLNILLGLPDNTIIELDTLTMFKEPTVTTWEDYLQKGIENRSDLKAAQYQLKASEANIRVAKSSHYPSFGLNAGYFNAYIPNVLTMTNALNGGFGLQYNITSLFSRSVIQHAKAKQQQAALSELIAGDNARIEIKKNFLNYQKAQEKIRISKQAIEQAQENYLITKNKYNAGLVILSDYLEADVILLQTQINYASARSESMIAYYELEESTGSIQ